MLLTRISELRFVHTTGTHLSVADMLSGDFSKFFADTCQLKHEAILLLVEFLELQPDKSLKQFEFLAEHEETLPSQNLINIPYSLTMVLIK